VPLVECVLTVAKAGEASEVRRLGRTGDVDDDDDVASGPGATTVRLLARLRLLPSTPTGDGGKVVGGFVSVAGLSLLRSTGQRWTRRKKPCDLYVRTFVAICLFLVEENTRLDDAEARESPNVDAKAAHVVVLHPLENGLSRPHSGIQMKELWPIWDRSSCSDV
jgi:hypothetical protein